MFIKLPEVLKKRNPLETIWLGTVVDNNDPKRLGRVKVSIPGLWDGIETDDLPWCSPINPYGLGGSSNCSWFSVPEVGSEVLVCFPYKDPHFPFYFGYFQTSKTHQTKFDADYPNSYGWVDSKGNYLLVDKSSGQVTVNHFSGTTITIDSSGNVSIQIVGNDTVNISGDCSLTVQGSASVKASGGVTIDGGSGSLSGVVTQQCICPFTGAPHSDYSGDVKASK